MCAHVCPHVCHTCEQLCAHGWLWALSHPGRAGDTAEFYITVSQNFAIFCEILAGSFSAVSYFCKKIMIQNISWKAFDEIYQI